MFRPDLNAFITVVSSGRSSCVANMETITNGPLTFYVAEKDVAEYTAECEATKRGSVVKVGGKLCPARNAALKDAWAEGLACVQLSDDLVKLELVEDVGSPIDSEGNPVKLSKDSYLKTVPTTFDVVVNRLHDALDKTGAYLAGVAPVCNLFYINNKYPITSASFIIGDFFLARPNEIFFDETLQLKEDYDMTLNHMHRYGAVARDNFVFARFLHYDNPGGAVAYRNVEREQASINLIMAKWKDTIHGKYLKLNPRRENEIMFRAPKKLDRYVMELRQGLPVEDEEQSA